MIPYARQDITDADIEAVVEVLKGDFITQGPAIKNFEDKFAEVCDAKYAIAVSNCTAALHLACLALGLGQGDILWSVPNTFVASTNCGLYCGAKVDFVDIDSHTWNISIPALKAKLEKAKVDGALPKILVPVHFSGRSCDMESIAALSKEYGFKVIEDAAHCIGASHGVKPVGACEFSDIAVFSTHPAKIITTGEGGLITTNDEALYQKIMRLRTHGITKDPAHLQEVPHGEWYFEQQELGLNYRMTDLQAALGASQIARLDGYIQRRRNLVRRYNEKLNDLPLQLPMGDAIDESSWHLYVVRLKTEEITATHNEVFTAMRAAGIGVNLHYIPVHLHPHYQELGFKVGDFPSAEKYYREAITLPLFPTLTKDEQDAVCEALRKAIA